MRWWKEGADMKRPLWCGVIVTRDVSGLYGRFEAWVTYRRRDGQTVCEPAVVKGLA
jgi:hypothetical protein